MDVNPYIFDEMAVPPQRLRLEMLMLQLRQIHRQQENIVAAVLLIEEELARQERRRRIVWVKPCLLRRTTLGHYDTLMQELMRKSRGYHTVASRCPFKTARLTYGSLVMFCSGI